MAKSRFAFVARTGFFCRERPAIAIGKDKSKANGTAKINRALIKIPTPAPERLQMTFYILQKIIKDAACHPNKTVKKRKL
ncbi:MAG: hypothetical protein WBC93_15960 [Sulfitobacter sp.]